VVLEAAYERAMQKAEKERIGDGKGIKHIVTTSALWLCDVYFTGLMYWDETGKLFMHYSSGFSKVSRKGFTFIKHFILLLGFHFITQFSLGGVQQWMVSIDLGAVSVYSSFYSNVNAKHITSVVFS